MTTAQFKWLDRRTEAIIPRPLWDAVREPILGWAMARVPDRRFLETVVFPWLLRTRRRRILFIGVSRVPDTRRYHRLLAGADFWTLDRDPAAARFGAPRHVVADLRGWVPDVPPFDAVLLNGVVGWGLDTLEDCDAALATCARALAPGGLLQLGWNTPRQPDPRRSRSLEALFAPCDGPAGQFMAFDRCDHVIGFWSRR